MHEQKNTIDCYNSTALKYAEAYINELDHKHLDGILLRSFANENIHKGKLIDLGCGPGQTTKFLFDTGFTDIMGVDISPAMVATAKQINPMLRYDTADMLNLDYPDNTFGSAIAFYSIVHFNMEQVSKAFTEINRVLASHGQFLFSFHIGKEIVHLNEFLDQQVSIDFHFFEPAIIIELLHETGFEIIDAIEREPYSGIEYPSRRAYFWARKK